MRRTLSQQLADARRKAGLDPTEGVTANTPSGDGDGRPKMPWHTVNTSAGPRELQAQTLADAHACIIRRGLAIVEDAR